MRIYGRITVYGEYLMHGNIPGLIFPSELFLDTARSGDVVSLYSKEKDSVLPLIMKLGITPKHTLYGNLPLGFGLAGSTTLSLLHLSNLEDQVHKKKIVNEIDREVHGFIPSGLDYESCNRQEWGFYCNASGWQSISPLPITYSLFMFPKEELMDLVEVQKRVFSLKDRLVPLQIELNRTIKEHSRIDLEILREYSEILLKTEVYSLGSSHFISTLLNQGIIAKGIGGLYDKVVLVIHSGKIASHSKLEELAREYAGTMISNTSILP